jgi:hypothetical protein
MMADLMGGCATYTRGSIDVMDGCVIYAHSIIFLTTLIS